MKKISIIIILLITVITSMGSGYVQAANEVLSNNMEYKNEISNQQNNGSNSIDESQVDQDDNSNSMNENNVEIDNIEDNKNESNIDYEGRDDESLSNNDLFEDEINETDEISPIEENEILSNTNSRTIEEGVYVIESAINNKFVLDVANGSTTSGANVQIYQNKSLDSQRFKIEYLSNGYYIITAMHSNMVLDVANAGQTAGTNVWQCYRNDLDAQQWLIQDAGDGYYYLISKCNGLYLDIANGIGANGTNVDVAYGNGSNAQKFKFIKYEEDTSEIIPEKTIEEGIYTIKSAINNDYVLDVENASTTSGANVQIYQNRNIESQKFQVEYLKDGYYIITAVHSGMVLDVANAGQTAGTNVWQCYRNDLDAQQWIIQDAGDGYYYLISKCNGLYLDVANGIGANGTNVDVAYGNNSNAQKFKFEKYEEKIPEKTIEDGTYTIKSAINNNYVLDVSGGSTESGANVQIYQNMLLASQRFQVEYLDNGYYIITAVHSGMVLDVANAGQTAGTNVWQCYRNDLDAQQWIIQDAGDGYYYLISKCNGLYLDVANGIGANGTNVDVAYGNNSNAQKFKFEEVSESQQLANGKYVIKSAINNNFVLDVANGSKMSGANVQIYENLSLQSQEFNVEYLNDGYYTITATHSNMVLDVANAGQTAGTNVWQCTPNGADAQKWIIQDAGNGYYNLISKCNGLYLDVTNGIASNGTNVEVAYGNGSNAQKFKFELADIVDNQKTIEDGIYSIVTGISNDYALDVNQGSRVSGANVQIYKRQATKRQEFRVKYLGNGYYSIMAVHSNMMLDVANAGQTAGTNVWQCTPNGADAQKWLIKDIGNGYYNLISKCNGLYLDIANGIGANGTNVDVAYGNGSNAQKFKFVEPLNILNSIDTNKYPGYKEKIADLINKHPDWNFELLYTGLTYSQVIAGERSVHGRNLVPTNYSGEWICPICGTKLYDSGWYCASEKAVAYYMDPRNFLNESSVFQFQDVNDYTHGVCTYEGIQSYVNGTYLQNYVSAIDNACKSQNVNPYYIVSRLIQEQGRKGTSIGTGMDGGDGKIYYNPFNIGASGDGYDTIYANALATAKSYGWDTMEKAISGGITFCKKNWLENYQNTLYQNKFDIDTRNGSNLYEHQYMQNLMAAYSEASTMRIMYANTGKIDSGFTFIIPVYENMDTNPYPIPVNNSETYPMNVQAVNNNVEIKQSADTNSATLRIVNTATELLSVQRGVNTSWHKVITTDGVIGYIQGNNLKQINDIYNCNYSASVDTSDDSGCWTRIGPSLNLDRYSLLNEGTIVTVLNEGTYNNITGYDWCRVQLPDGTQGFMPKKFLRKN